MPSVGSRDRSGAATKLRVKRVSDHTGYCWQAYSRRNGDVAWRPNESDCSNEPILQNYLTKSIIDVINKIR